MAFPIPIPVKAITISKNLNVELVGDSDLKIKSVSPLSFAQECSITFYSGAPEAVVDALSRLPAGCLIVLSKEAFDCTKRCDISYLIVSHARFGFIQSVSFLMAQAPLELTGVSSLASIDPSAVIGEESGIGPFVYVAKDVKVGKRCQIYPGVYLGKGTVIGDDVRIYSNTVIGLSGQSSERNQTGEHVHMPHLAGVRIGNRTYIGANTTIAQGSLENTEIGNGCSIGNQVNIGHNCKVGEDCFISASCTLGGSTQIGDRAWLAPGVTSVNKVKIGNNAILGLGSVVVKPVAADTFVAGNPARAIRQNNDARYNQKRDL